MSKALPLDVQNLFEEQIDSRIDSAIKRYDARSGEYPAVVTRQGTDGMWWCRVVGNEEETPIMTTLTEMSVGDTIRLVIKDGRTTAQGNETAPAATNISIEYSVQASLNPVLADLKDLDLDNAKIKTLVADRATIEDLEAEKARIGILEVNTADISDIRINAAKVQNLTAAQLEADHATVESLDSNYAHITNGVIDNATIGYADVNGLDANYAHITDGVIDNATIGYADVDGLDANYAKITDLEANYAQIDMANVNNAWISNGVVKDGAITNAMINSVSANKLTAGTIDASNINVTNLNADNLTTGTINGQRIGTGSLSLDKLSEDVYTEAEVNTIVNGLNDRIDGAIETFTGTAVPTLQNTPASSWDTAALKDQHVGDVYYVVNSQSQQNGYCYRFTKSGTGSSATYSWQLIKDSDVTAALSRLQTAEGKIGDIEAFDVTMSTFKTDTEGAISTLQTKTTNLETSLGDKVSTSTFNELSQTVDGNSATITTLSTTTQTLRTDLDNLEIGGRNLLRSSAMSDYVSITPNASTDFTKYFRHYNGNAGQHAFEEISQGVFQDTITLNTSGNLGIAFARLASEMNLDPSSDYTLSCWAKCTKPNADLCIGLSYYDTSDAWVWRGGTNPKAFTATDAWQFFTLMFKPDANTKAICYCFTVTGAKGGTDTFSIRNCKLEKGNKATDWTPAPEDMATAASVTTVSNTVNQVSQTATSNSSKISQLTTTLGTNADGTTKTGDIVHRTSAVEQDLSGFKSTVSSTYATKNELSDASSGAEITKSASGQRTIVTEDAADLPLLTLAPVVGESVQTGTPTPSAPVPIKSVKLVWNQFFAYHPTSAPGVKYGVTLANNHDGTFKFTGTFDPTATGDPNFYGVSNQTISVAANHKYLLHCGSEHAFLYAWTSGINTGANRTTPSYIYTATSDAELSFAVQLIRASSAWTDERLFSCMCYDLTAMFGADNEPATVAEFESLFPEDYYPYESGKNCLLVVSEFEGTIIDTTYIDLKGHDLHGLDSTYCDTLDIDASRHAVITKRTVTDVLDNSSDEVWGRATNYEHSFTPTHMRDNLHMAYYSNTAGNTAEDKLTSYVPVFADLFDDYGAGASDWATFNATSYKIKSPGFTDHIYFTLPDITTTNDAKAWFEAHPTKVVVPLRKSYWYTIDLGYVDLPQVTDDSTVYVAAEVQPVISGSWWTKAGSSVGQLAQQSKDSQGVLESPYTEVEWVESNGKQFVYLDWKPPIATWGFEADFIVRNTFTTTLSEWNASTNTDGFGNIFGVRNSSIVNDVQFGTYGVGGILRNGTGGYSTSGLLKTDGTRQTVSYKGTSLKRGDGTTVTFARTSETANKPYANMVVFAMHEGLRRGGSGNLVQPGTVRIYSLKFYESTALKVDLVGAIRKKDGVTGLYDKVAGKFYPAPGMTYGNPVGELGEPETIVDSFKRSNIKIIVDNTAGSRMWQATVPDLEKLEDGQQITVTPMYAVVGSSQTSNLPEWDDTTSNSNVYLKLTLADGSETEWVPCYYTGVTRLTTHYGAGIPLLMTYREDVFYNASATAPGSTVMKGWFRDPNYDTNDTYTRYSDSVIAGKNGVKRYSLCMKDDAGNITSIANQDNNINATGKTCYTGGLQLGGVYYHNANAAYAAGASTGQIWESRGGIDFRYNVNGVTNAQGTTELQLRKPVYLVGTLNENDGLFYLDTTKWWTQTSFTIGKVYVLVGHAYSSYYAIFLAANNPSYVWNGTKLVEFEYSRIVQAETKIEQTDNSILSLAQAGATWTAPDGTTQTNQTAAKLELKANKATLTSEINASADTIKISADRVNIEGATLFTSGRLSSTSLSNAYDAKGAASTAETNAKAYTDSVEIGGRNLLAISDRKGSSYLTGKGLSWTFGSDGWIFVSGTVEGTSAGLGQLWGTRVETDYIYGPGKYTISVDNDGVLTGSDGKIRVQVTYANPTRTNNAVYLYDTGFTYFEVPEGYGISRVVLYMATNATGTVVNGKLRIKLEKGNKATDWTPAPEDTDTAITTSSYQTAQPNLVPWFSSQPLATTNPHWNFVTNLGTVTDMGDGWLRFQYTNSSGSTKKALEMNCVLVPSVKQGATYTWLVEMRNNHSTIGSGQYCDIYLVQTDNNQFWGATASKVLDDGLTSSRTDMALKLTDTVNPVVGDIRRTKVSEASGSSHWASGATEATNGCARWNWNVTNGTVIDAEFRISLYEGEYLGPWKPYSGELLYANLSDSVEYIVGTQTGTTNVWTGVTRDSALYTGKKIAYYLPYAGNNLAATLNLTLAGGGTTGAKNVRWNNSNVTTHYPQYSVIQLVYDGTYWRTSAYNSDTLATRYANSVVAGLNGVKRYSLCMQDKNGLWTSIVNQDNNTAASGKTCYTGGLQLGKVLYHNANGAYSYNAATGEMWESRNTLDFRYSVNGVTNDAGTTTLQLRKFVYLVGTIGDDGLYYLDTSKWWTQEPDDTEKVYVLIGNAHNNGAPHQVNLIANNTAYIFDGIGLVEYASSRINSAEQDIAAQVTATEQVQQGVNDLDDYVRGYSYMPTQDGELAVAGVTYYNRSVTTSYAVASVETGMPVDGYYAKSGNSYIAATGTAQSGVTYYERVDTVSYDAASVSTGASVQGLYIYTDAESVEGRLNSTNTRVETGFAEQDGINDAFRASIAAVQTELHSAVLVDPSVPNVTVGYMNDQQVFQGYRSVLGPNGMEIVAPLPNDTSVAMYGATQRIGAENAPHMVSDGSTLMFLPSNGADISQAVAYVQYDEDLGESFMYLAKARVLNEIQLGKWAWRPRANGNLSLKWIGGEVQ